MKTISFILFSLLIFSGYTQEFYPSNFSGTISPPLNGTSNCGAISFPLTNSPLLAITFDVSGVNTLNTTTNTLYRIDIELNFDFGCGTYTSGQKPNQDDDLQLILVAPDGTCALIYNADWSSTGGNFSYSVAHNQVIGLSSVGCSLQNPTGQALSTSVVNYTPNSTSNFGVFASVSDLVSTFNGVDANGTWTILMDNTSTNRPFCIASANTKLFFASNEINDEIGNGGQCVDAVVWNGSPTCLTTDNQPVSPNLPGWNGGPDGTQGNFDNFNNGACLWNAQNNNSVWIEFTPQSNEEICLSINGIDNGEAQQSIIVTDPNTDGDNNPCTGAGNGSYWDVVSCPNGPIYNGTAGSASNQMHCFIPTPGQTYYIVVDGSAGASSEIFLYGVNNGAIALPVELTSFSSNCTDDKFELTWTTNSELNNDYFIVERSYDGINFEPIDRINGSGTTNKKNDYLIYDDSKKDGLAYYKLSQVDYNGVRTKLKILASKCSKNNEFLVFPNPVKPGSLISVSGLNRGEFNIQLTDLEGRVIHSEKQTVSSDILILSSKFHPSKGIYTLQISNESQNKTSILIVE